MPLASRICLKNLKLLHHTNPKRERGAAFRTIFASLALRVSVVNVTFETQPNLTV